MMKPLVSILIPAYNAQHSITDTLKSAIDQTWPRKEIIVVDDGSKDETLSVARRFASAGVTIVTQENQGAAAARNKAFSVSQGDFIQWLDADDLLSHDKIARQMDLVERAASPRTLISCSWGRFLFRHHRAEFVPSGLWADLTPAEWLMRKLEENVYMQTATWLVSREVTAKAGPWDTKLLGDDDGEYFTRVLLESDGVRFDKEAKVFYRMSGSSSLSYIGHSNKKMEAQLRSMKLTVGYLRKLDNGPRARAAALTYLQNWLINFYPERLDIVEELQRMALELGGRLQTPRLSWKYSWMSALFGLSTAKRAQVLLPQIRWSAVRLWDKTLSHVDSGRTAEAGAN
jgi:glycosyltransferase involved in cell wall biosynthesis